MQHEHEIRCRLSQEDRRSSEDGLSFEIDGQGHEIKLKIHELSEKLVRNPPAVLSDLVEIAGEFQRSGSRTGISKCMRRRQSFPSA